MNALNKFQCMLRELFEFDHANLDFGIYRIMNHRRAIIERLITQHPRKVTAEKPAHDALADPEERNEYCKHNISCVLPKAHWQAPKPITANANFGPVQHTGHYFAPAKRGRLTQPKESSMPRKKNSTRATDKRLIETYEHRDKERVNNPPAGLVTPQTDPESGQKKKRYVYHPHLDLLPYYRRLQAQGITS